MGWVTVVVIAALTRTAAGFSCDAVSSHVCICPHSTSSVYELLCPQQLTVQIKLHESVQLQCGAVQGNTSFSTLSGLQIGDIDRFVLRFCPLPDMSISDLMANMGIKKVKMLQIHSYSSLNDTLQKKHFEKLYNITNLSLNDNGLTTLPRDIFEEMGNLTWLDMKNNNIALPIEMFYFTPKLDVLELGRNNLTHLKPGIFKNLDRLRLLNLWGNRLSNLTRAVFSDVPNLESLDLNSNQMETIRPDVFADLIKLKRLNLYANAFVSLPQGLLSRNMALEEFQMHENKRSLVSLPFGFMANLTELKMVRLSACKLLSLPEDIFVGSKRLEMVYLNRNSLDTVAEKTFMDLENLEILDLSENLITHLPEGLFSKTKKLRRLILHYNQLTEIPQDLFLYNKRLEFLDLRFNKIKEIRGGQFHPLEGLKTLNISDNQLTTLGLSGPQFTDYGDQSVLRQCQQLEDLQLANNSLTELYGDWRLLLTSLRTLNLHLNHINTVTVHELDFLADVSIDLSNNNITFVNFWEAKLVAFSHLENFNTSYERDARIRPKHIKLDNNPFNCDCQLLPFVQFIRDGLSPEVQYIFSISNNNLKCDQPKKIEKMPLKNVPYELLTCEFFSDHNCPAGCSCYFRPFDNGNIIDCQGVGLQQLPPSLPLWKKSNHSELNLDGNHLKSFQIPQNKGYENVTSLILSNNNITSLNTSGLSSKMQVLDLSNNNLTVLNEEVILFLEDAPTLKRLTLHGNPWHCDCHALSLIRFLKSNFVKVERLHNITCEDKLTSLDSLDESELCADSARLVMLICLIIAVFCIIVVILTTLYFNYRTQVHIYCFSSKWRVLRWMVSHPDIDEDKKFDAFISYSHQDESFVTEYLVPHLEESGDTKFKLCLHFRDWVPGESIPNQILHSVQNSRRTIVVLSPSFLDSVWGKVEFRTAHSEALKDGTARVIVLLYEDVGPVQDLDEELRAYLQMNTYVKWGSPWFWQQLHYALPHPPEDAEDIKCIFGCFPKISKDSSSHEVLQNVLLRDGEVHYMPEVTEKVNGKDRNLSPSADSAKSTLIIECTDTKTKQISNDNSQNGIATVCV